MRDQIRKPLLERAGMLALGAGGLLGPIAWAAHQNVSYNLAYATFESGTMWPFHLATVVALAVCIGGGAVSWLARPAAAESDADRERSKAAARGRFVAMVCVLLSALPAAGILVETIPLGFLDPCSGAT